MFALDFATQAQQMKSIGGQAEYSLGSAVRAEKRRALPLSHAQTPVQTGA